MLDKHEATINSQNTGTLCTLLIHLTKQLSPVPCSYSQEYLDPDSVDTMFSYHALPKESLGILLDSKLEKWWSIHNNEPEFIEPLRKKHEEHIYKLNNISYS